MTAVPRERPRPASRTRRPAVVEHVDPPRSISDGRTITPTAPGPTAPSAPEATGPALGAPVLDVVIPVYVRPVPLRAT